MRDPFNWSLTLGRPFGIQVRLHFILVLFVAAELLRSLFAEQGMFGPGETALMLAVLFTSVLLHEFGHCFAGRRVGGHADDILLWPLGGLAYVDAPQTWRDQLTVAVGGPLVSLGLMAASVAALWLFGAPVDFNPFAGLRLPDRALLTGPNVLTFVFRLNEILLLFNLLPAFPLDGGRVLQCMLWRRMSYSRATLLAVQVGKFCAIGLGFAGILTIQGGGWMLLFIALFVYLNCERTRQEVESGMNYGAGYGGSWDVGRPEEGRPRRPGLLARWRKGRRLKKLRSRRQQEDDDQRRVDQILEKLHREGMDSLSQKEKDLLIRTSARYRSQRAGRRD